jgi:hypothetical protein
VLRAALDHTAIHTPGAIELRDANGAPLDLARSFTTDDDQRSRPPDVSPTRTRDAGRAAPPRTRPEPVATAPR